jgi:hypothetical protein
MSHFKCVSEQCQEKHRVLNPGTLNDISADETKLRSINFATWPEYRLLTLDLELGRLVFVLACCTKSTWAVLTSQLGLRGL